MSSRLVSVSSTVCLLFAVLAGVAKFESTPDRDEQPVAVAASAKCELDWGPMFGGPAGVDGVVHALAYFDDGTGPALYLGGNFRYAGGLLVNGIVKWNGDAWVPLQGGLSFTGAGGARDLAVFDDGSGPALYVGGYFTAAGSISAHHIARWDGQSWTALGLGLDNGVHAMVVHDGGSDSESKLYVTGNFTAAGGTPAGFVANWDGKTWTPVGDGLSGTANAIAFFDDGAGSEAVLYVGGWFASAGGQLVNRIARLDGDSWSPVGSGIYGLSNYIDALHVFTDSDGNTSLYAGGSFDTAGGVNTRGIARWDGNAWHAVGTGLIGGAVHAITTHDSGNGPQLYAAGGFTNPGNASWGRIARWDGESWSIFAGGLHGLVGGSSPFASTLLSFTTTSGESKLAVGGRFLYAGGVLLGNLVNSVAVHSSIDSAWKPLNIGLSDRASALLGVTCGTNVKPGLYVGGWFRYFGNEPLRHIGLFDGESLIPIGGGFSGNSARVSALKMYDDGSGAGAQLYAGGLFDLAGGVAASSIAKWNGFEWLPLGEGVSGQVLALAVFDDGSGPSLYAAGSFSNAGGSPASNIAKWNGTSWSVVGSGINGTVFSLIVFDDGMGPSLYAGGQFTQAGGTSANRVAKWNGSTWSSLGAGLNQWVDAMAVFDDGTGFGPALYAGGAFTNAGGTTAAYIAKWPGIASLGVQQWQSVGDGMNARVMALEVFDDGSGDGPALYAGGNFTAAGGTAANRIAKWDGVSWSALGEGISNVGVAVMESFDTGNGPALFVGGWFTDSAFGDAYLAKWSGCSLSEGPLGDLNGDGIVDVSDLLILLSAWGICDDLSCVADLDGDCTIDVSDLIILLANWG